MGMYGSSGEDSFEVDLNWDCRECKQYNDRTCWADGSTAVAICKYCGYEQEIYI